MRCRIFPFESGDGPSNMALDEAMLDAVARDPSCAALRTYGWTEPTLSLGYFQKVVEAEDEDRWRGVPMVRRPTGGGAIWHHHELTYALVIPTAHPLADRRTTLYHEVHTAIAGMLRARGVDARRRGCSSTPHLAARPLLCFSDSDPEDIVCQGIKIVGSAQRRRSDAILQHGSLLLKRSPTTPELVGAGDLAEIPCDPQDWSDIITERLARALDLDASTEPISESVRRRSLELEQTVYRRDAWNRRR